jgi:hypothetical protein
MVPIGIFCARQKAKPENHNSQGKYRQRTIGQRLTRPENDIKRQIEKQDGWQEKGDIRLGPLFPYAP